MFVARNYVKYLMNQFQEIKSFISGHSAILFSLGKTGFDPQIVPYDLIEILLKAFGDLKDYRIIMRFDDQFIKPETQIPKNVLVKAWVPQQDVLGNYIIISNH